MLDVLIAGAGPTGLTTALQLVRSGHQVRIIDAAAAPFAGSRGDGIQPRTMEVFDDLGIVDTVLDQGSAPFPTRIYVDGHYERTEQRFLASEGDTSVPYPTAWFLAQWRTETILRERLAQFGVRPEFATRLVDVVDGPDGVRATVSVTTPALGAERTVHARYVVGADGGRSTVRKALGIDFIGTTTDELRIMLGDVGADLDRRFSYAFTSAHSSSPGIGLTPLTGSGLFQFAAPVQVHLDDSLSDAEPTLPRLQRHLDHFTGAHHVPLRDLGWSTIWRPNIRLAQRYRAGAIFLAGDAAHVHPPTGGQGLNTSVQDGYNLGWKLAAVLSGAPPALLDTYETERWPIAASVLKLSSDILGKYAERATDADVRDTSTHQLDVHYRGSALSEDQAPVLSRLRAGDRLPDADLGVGKRLHDLLRHPGWTVFGFDKELRMAHTHRIDSADARQNLGVSAAAVLVVRPDGHLGFVGDDETAAMDYVQRWSP